MGSSYAVRKVVKQIIYSGPDGKKYVVDVLECGHVVHVNKTNGWWLYHKRRCQECADKPSAR